MKHLYFFLIVSFCSSLLSCTNDDSFLAHDFETQQNRALSIYTGNYNIYQIAKKVSLPSASTTKLNSVITNCCNDYPVIKWLHNYAKDKKYIFYFVLCSACCIFVTFKITQNDYYFLHY